jgi:hypothetical protein
VDTSGGGSKVLTSYQQWEQTNPKAFNKTRDAPLPSPRIYIYELPPRFNAWLNYHHYPAYYNSIYSAGGIPIFCLFREHTGNIQGSFGDHSGNIQGAFREHSGNIQGTFREHLDFSIYSAGAIPSLDGPDPPD